jgi:hypothetical protein
MHEACQLFIKPRQSADKSRSHRQDTSQRVRRKKTPVIASNFLRLEKPEHFRKKSGHQQNFFQLKNFKTALSRAVLKKNRPS